MALTGRKQKFADAVLAGFSNREAAIRAGYSEASASQAGSRNVKDPDVIAYIAKKRAVPSAPPAKAPKAAAGKPTMKSKAPPPADEPTSLASSDPLVFLVQVMTGEIDANITQVKAATAMLPFKHRRLGEQSKKELADAEAAEVAGSGKYATRTGPRGSMKH